MKSHETASRIWPVLVHAATNRQTIYYGELNKLIGHGSNHLGVAIQPIQAYCLLHGLPALNSLAIGKASGKPGEGFYALDVAKLKLGQQRVYDYDWLNAHTPMSEELRLAAAEFDENSSTITLSSTVVTT